MIWKTNMAKVTLNILVTTINGDGLNSSLKDRDSQIVSHVYTYVYIHLPVIYKTYI